MGPRSQYLETVLTCEGDFYSPDFHKQLSVFRERLQQLIFLAEDERNLILKKVEPWNSVKVTFNIPPEAARRLRELAEHHDNILRELGVLAVQIDGDRVISLSVGGSSKPSVSASRVSEPAVRSTSIEAPMVLTSESKRSPRLSPVAEEPWKTVETLDSAAKTVVVPPTASFIKPASFDGHVQPELLTSSAVHASSGMLSLNQWPNNKAAPTLLVAAQHAGLGAAFQFTHAGGALNVPLPSFTSMDANAVAAAVQLAQLKLLPGACPNIASSSPLLVNLLQTRRQLNALSSGATQLPVSSSFEAPGAMLPPPPKRRRSQPRKPKPPPSFKEAKFVSTVSPVTNLPSSSFPSVTAESVRLATAPLRQGAQHSWVCNEPLLHTQMESVVKSDEGLPVTPQILINPYTGKMELIETADPDDPNFSSRINLNNVIHSSNSFVQSLASSLSSKEMQCDDINEKSMLFLPSTSTATNPFVWESPKNGRGSPAEVAKPDARDVSVSESSQSAQGILDLPPESVSSEQKDSSSATVIERNPCIPSPINSLSCRISAVSANPISEPKLSAPQVLGVGLSKAATSGIVSTVDSNHSLAEVQCFSLNVISSLKTVLPVNRIGTVQSGELLNSRLSIPVSSTCQQVVINYPSVPMTSVPFRQAINLVRPASSSITALVTSEKPELANVRPSLGNAGSVVSSVALKSSLSNNQLMHLAYAFTKQNGRVLPPGDDATNKTCSFVNNYSSAQPSSCPSMSVRGPLAVTNAESSAIANTLKAVTCSSTLSSSSTGFVAPSESCFFPAVSCFPPEQRRKGENRLVAIGGIAESQALATIVPSLAGTVPAIRISTSDIPVTPLISSNWLSATSGVCNGNLRNPTIATGVTTMSATLPVSFSSTNAAVNDTRNSMPVPVTAVSAGMFTFGLHTDALQRLIPRLFPVSVVSSASSPTDIQNIQSMQVLTKAPVAVGFEGKANMAVSIEQNMLLEKIAVETSGTGGMAQYVSSVSDLANKSRLVLAGKQNKLSAMKDRRYGNSKTAEDIGLQRGSNKSHLTVAQLLEQVKNSRITKTSSGEDFSAELSMELLTAMVQSSDGATVNNSCSTSPVSAPRIEAVSKALVDQLQKNTNPFPIFSVPAGLPPSMPQSPMPPTSKPPSPVRLKSVPPLTSLVSPSLPASMSLLPGLSASLPPPPPSLAHIVPVTAFAMPHQLAITSPRYPINLTESMKRAMRGVGFYPSPPASPTAAIGLLMRSNAVDSCKDAAVAEGNAKTVAATVTCSEMDRTEKQFVLSEILNELSKSESISKYNICKSVDSETAIISSATDYTETTLLETNVLKSPERAETAVPLSGICSLPDLIVSTTGLNGVIGRSSESSPSPNERSQRLEDDALNAMGGDHKLRRSLDCGSTNTDTADCSDTIIKPAKSCESIGISAERSNEKRFHSRSSPVSQLLSQNLEPVTAVPGKNTKAICTSALDLDFGTKKGVFPVNSTTQVVFSELHSRESSTLDTLQNEESSKSPVLVNGDVAEATSVLQQADAVEGWVPEAVHDDGSLLNDSFSTASVGEDPTPSMLTVRSSSRRGARQLQNWASLVPSTSCSLPFPKAAESNATKRMTTRSSNRTTSTTVPMAADPVTSDAVSSASSKLATRRTPSKVPEVPYSAVDTPSAVSSSQETDSISASSRRSPRIITCAVDGRKPELLSASESSTTTGLSLRSRAKATHNAKTVINSNSMVRRTVAKGAVARQSDLLLENCTSDVVTRTGYNCVKCDVNGSDEIL